MTRPWQTLASAATPEGLLELRRRGERDFLIVIGGRVLMTSSAHRSEDALSTLAAARLAKESRGKKKPRVLIGGLGMAYTLRAALDAFPGDAAITVAELNPVVLEWCKGPLAELTAGAASHPRVTLINADVAAVIAKAAASPGGKLDAILLDLYEGPNAASQRRDDPFYSAAALAQQHAALTAGGILAVWSEDPDAAYAKRFAAAGFTVNAERPPQGGRTHVVYLGVRR